MDRSNSNKIVFYFDVCYSKFFLGIEQYVNLRPWETWNGYACVYKSLKRLFYSFTLKEQCSCVAVFDEAEKAVLEYEDGRYTIVRASSQRTRIGVIGEFLKMNATSRVTNIIVSDDPEIKSNLERMEKNPQLQQVPNMPKFKLMNVSTFLSQNQELILNQGLLEREIKLPVPTYIVEPTNPNVSFLNSLRLLASNPDPDPGPPLEKQSSTSTQKQLMEESEAEPEFSSRGKKFIFDCNNMMYMTRSFVNLRPWARGGRELVQQKLVECIHGHHKVNNLAKSYALFDSLSSSVQGMETGNTSAKGWAPKTPPTNAKSENPGPHILSSANAFMQEEGFGMTSTSREENERFWTFVKVIMDNNDGETKFKVLKKQLAIWAMDTRFLRERLDAHEQFRVLENGIVVFDVASEDELVKKVAMSSNPVEVKKAKPIFGNADDFIVKLVEYELGYLDCKDLNVVTSDRELKSRIARLGSQYKVHINILSPKEWARMYMDDVGRFDETLDEFMEI